MMTNSNIKVTILTPTYNRAYTIPKLYASLCRQTDRRFIWVIVDDGSTDQTKDVVSGFGKDFEIHYIYKENGGKHTAVNTGMKLVQTEYTFIVDSDDYLKDYAVELVNHWIEDISGVAGLAGVAGLRVNGEDQVIGQFPDNCDYIDCLNSERRRYKLWGDKAEIYKTELLKKHPFPVYDDERFMPESIVWNQFALEGLKVRWYKKCIKVCEYLDDGLTSATKSIQFFKKNYKGYRDDSALSFKVLKFPYNCSALSVFYARCCAAGKKDGCLEEVEMSDPERFLIILLGRLRHRTGRY